MPQLNPIGEHGHLFFSRRASTFGKRMPSNPYVQKTTPIQKTPKKFENPFPSNPFVQKNPLSPIPIQNIPRNCTIQKKFESPCTGKIAKRCYTSAASNKWWGASRLAKRQRRVGQTQPRRANAGSGRFGAAAAAPRPSSASSEITSAHLPHGKPPPPARRARPKGGGSALGGSSPYWKSPSASPYVSAMGGLKGGSARPPAMWPVGG